MVHYIAGTLGRPTIPLYAHLRVQVSCHIAFCMMTPSNGNIFRITGLLCWEFTGHWWISHTKASDAELWRFRWSAPWINGWVNNCEAGNLRCHHAHYDIIVMGQRITVDLEVSVFKGLTWLRTVSHNECKLVQVMAWCHQATRGDLVEVMAWCHQATTVDLNQC